MSGTARLRVGVDEAGRGPVLGPLVLCAVAADARGERRLAALGLADSKVLAPAERERLAPEIRAVAAVRIRVLSPAEVDAAVRQGGLNELEARATAGLLRESGAAEAFVDALGPKPRRYGLLLESLVRPARIRVTAEAKADERRVLVMAASIVAKVERDAAIAALAAEHGEIGSGYPGDPRTVGFLRRCLAAGSLPPFVRTSWATLRRLGGEPA